MPTLPKKIASRHFWRNRIAAALALAIMALGTAHAEVRVKGSVKAARVEAVQANLTEVLFALKSAFGLRVNASTALAGDISGTYTGSLAQILSSVLRGYNYFIRWRADEIEVTVVGLQNVRAAALVRPRPHPTRAMSLAEAVRRKVR